MVNGLKGFTYGETFRGLSTKNMMLRNDLFLMQNMPGSHAAGDSHLGGSNKTSDDSKMT